MKLNFFFNFSPVGQGTFYNVFSKIKCPERTVYCVYKSKFLKDDRNKMQDTYST